MATRRASCSCGQLTVEVEGDPLRVSICHCLACQRRTGSVFGAQARWAREQARIEGDATEYVRISDEGDERSFFFCPRCGATVYYWIDAEHIAGSYPVLFPAGLNNRVHCHCLLFGSPNTRNVSEPLE